MKRENLNQRSTAGRSARKSHKRGSRIQNEDVLSKNLVLKQILIPCLIVIFASFAYLMWFNMRNNNVESQVAYIKQYYKNGVFNDWQGKLDCKGIEDIKWFRNEKMTEIDVGRIPLTWENDKFLTKSNLELIAQIGFEVKISKDRKTMKIYWCGQEVERWIK